MSGSAAATPAAGARLNLRPITVRDRAGLDAIADLHMELLSFGPMAGLGWRFVRDVCYAAHMQDDLLRVVLAEIDGQPAGFIAYTPKSIGFHRDGLSAHWLQAGLGLARALITNPVRIVKLVRALKVLSSRRGEIESAQDPLGEVVCVAVRKPYLAPAFIRQSGLQLSRLLIEESGRLLAALGVDRMRMIVDDDNKPVQILYHTMGARFEVYSQGGEARRIAWFDLDASGLVRRSH